MEQNLNEELGRGNLAFERFGQESSKKVRAKRITLGFGADAFKRPDDISDIMNSKVGGLIVVKKEFLSDSTQKEIEEYETEVKKDGKRNP